jgi:hypothetical protein
MDAYGALAIHPSHERQGFSRSSIKNQYNGAGLALVGWLLCSGLQ